MKTLVTIILIVILMPFTLWAQTAETDTVAKARLLKLSFMIGEWQGKGWMYGQDRQRHDFKQTEDIRFMLDSTAILVEGIGKSQGKVIHNAMAIITWNGDANHYIFHSFLSNGKRGEFKAEILDDGVYWYLNQSMRYIIAINPAGQWLEKGEINQGGSWFQFFEMMLDKR